MRSLRYNASVIFNNQQGRMSRMKKLAILFIMLFGFSSISMAAPIQSNKQTTVKKVSKKLKNKVQKRLKNVCRASQKHSCKKVKTKKKTKFNIFCF